MTVRSTAFILSFMKVVQPHSFTLFRPSFYFDGPVSLKKTLSYLSNNRTGHAPETPLACAKEIFAWPPIMSVAKQLLWSLSFHSFAHFHSDRRHLAIFGCFLFSSSTFFNWSCLSYLRRHYASWKENMEIVQSVHACTHLACTGPFKPPWHWNSTF